MPKVFSELLEFHQLLKTLIYREAQVFADQCKVNVFLVRLDDWVQISSAFDFVHVLHRQHYSAETIANPARMDRYAVSQVP